MGRRCPRQFIGDLGLGLSCRSRDTRCCDKKHSVSRFGSHRSHFCTRAPDNGCAKIRCEPRQQKGGFPNAARIPSGIEPNLRALCRRLQANWVSGLLWRLSHDNSDLRDGGGCPCHSQVRPEKCGLETTERIVQLTGKLLRNSQSCRLRWWWLRMARLCTSAPPFNP
jgi:hypothetical protein